MKMATTVSQREGKPLDKEARARKDQWMAAVNRGGPLDPDRGGMTDMTIDDHYQQMLKRINSARGDIREFRRMYGVELRRVRNELGLTLREVGTGAGVSHATVYDMEMGNSSFTEDTYHNVNEVLRRAAAEKAKEADGE